MIRISDEGPVWRRITISMVYYHHQLYIRWNETNSQYALERTIVFAAFIIPLYSFQAFKDLRVSFDL